MVLQCLLAIALPDLLRVGGGLDAENVVKGGGGKEREGEEEDKAGVEGEGAAHGLLPTL